MITLTTIAVSAAGPAAGLAWSEWRRRAVEAQDSRHLSALDSGADEAAWVARVAEQVEGCRVSPGLASELGRRGLVPESAVAATRRDGYAERYMGRPWDDPALALGTIGLLLVSLAVAAVTPSLWAVGAASVVGGCAIADWRWRLVPLPLLAALVACCVGMALESSAGAAPLVVGLVALALIEAFRLLAVRASGSGAFGLGDVLLLAAVASALAVWGGAAPSAFCLALVIELGCTLLVMRKRGRAGRPVPLVPFVAPALAVAACAAQLL